MIDVEYLVICDFGGCPRSARPSQSRSAGVSWGQVDRIADFQVLQ